MAKFCEFFDSERVCTMRMKFSKPSDRIVLPLDVSNLDNATLLVTALAPFVGVFKVGFEAIYSTMADLLTLNFGDAVNCLRKARALAQAIGNKGFFDVKLNDIPNTVGKAATAVARTRPRMFNLHASAGQDAIRAVVANKGDALIFVVTVLTSIKTAECESIFGDVPSAKVLQFADFSVDCGVDGIICAPAEGKLLRKSSKFDGLTVATPNIRPIWDNRADDQDTARQMSPRAAILEGIDMLVCGRPITNPLPEIGGSANAARRIADEVAEALS